MPYYSSPTFYFKDIFPTFEDFRELVDSQLYNVDLTDPEQLAYITYVYNALYRRYANSSVMYSMPDAFVRQLAGILDDVAGKYKRQKELAESVYELTEDDIREVNEAIVNGALNPNTSPTDPRKPLEYVSSQSASFTKTGKLGAYIAALNALPTVRQGELLREFAGLFRRYLTPNAYFYSWED